MRVAGLALVLLGSACTIKGQGKSSKPDWKMFQVEHPRSFPPERFRSGGLEFWGVKAFLEENKTVLGPSHWVARIRVGLLSPEALPLSDVKDEFTILGASGKTYRAYASTVGPGRLTWQHQEHSGQPTRLPAGVAGELDLFAQVGDDKTHDDVVAFTFRNVRVPLGR